MWLGEQLINHSVYVCGKEIRIGNEFAWVGIVYFMILLFFAITGVWASTSEKNSLAENAKKDFWLWFCCAIAIRATDILYSIYTLVCRRIDPRRRRIPMTLSIVARFISLFGGFASTIIALVFLSKYGSPPSALFAISFYCNFVPLFFFYFLFINPLGCCCLGWFLGCLQRRKIPVQDGENAVRNARQQERFDAHVHGIVRPDAQSRVRVTQKNTWSYFSSLFAADDTTECALCLEEYKDTDILEKLPCGHFFHDTCLAKDARYCPYCRQEISAETVDKHAHSAPIIIVE